MNFPFSAQLLALNYVLIFAGAGRRKQQLGAWEIKQLVREARAASCVRFNI